MIKVELNKDEVALVELLSRKRSQYNKKVKRNDLLKADKSRSAFIEKNGLGGEFATAKALNIYPDINSERITRFDILLPNGKKVEVKTTEYETGKLIVRNKNAADLYILVTGKIPEYKIIGYIYRNNLDDHVDKNINKGQETYVVEQKHLSPIEHLISGEYLAILVKHDYHSL
jgi:hypothetical protein